MYSYWYALYRTLYWTDWSESGPAIYRSSVVNPARETLVSYNIYIPNALAVDFTGKQSASTGCIKCIMFMLIYVSSWALDLSTGIRICISRSRRPLGVIQSKLLQLRLVREKQLQNGGSIG